MNWLIRTLGGAVIAGLGWKLGADAYEAIKKRISEREGEEGDARKGEEEPQPVPVVERAGEGNRRSGGR
ncbi:MAG: hypothetical protein IT371_01810 [Deltaproteobacteria bacterium]|nr:hypothetical protein [Deltaproteobacteria bacterium]